MNSADAEKSIPQNPMPYHDKIPSKLKILMPQHDKCPYENPAANITCNAERLTAFALRSESIHSTYFCHFFLAEY
jgi:hypothetical protein